MKVLFFKVNQLGDNLVDLPTVDYLVELCGATNVFVYTTPIAEGLYDGRLPKENLRIFDRDGFNGLWKRLAKLLKEIRHIRRLNLDLVLCPLDQGNVARLLSYCAGASARLGVESDVVKLTKIFKEKVRFNFKLSMQENNWRLLQEAGRLGLVDRPVPETPPAPVFRRKERANEKGVVIHPGSSRSATQWPRERYVQLAETLQSSGMNVLWMDEGGAKPASKEEGSLTILDRRPLPEFIQVLSSYAVFVGNNSGPMHLADALDLSLIIINGPAQKEWAPYWASNKLVIYADDLKCQPCETWNTRIKDCALKDDSFACLRRVSVTHVANLVLENIS